MTVGRFWLLLTLCLVAAAMSAPAMAERRVALVIGNSAYQNAPLLANPRNDAADMAAVLRKAGFEVIEGFDLDKRGFEMHLARFGRLAANADAALVFYAGHGMQSQGQNFLMPVDVKLEDEFAVQFETIRLDDILFALSQARVRLLVLDACRNNPLVERLARRSTTRAFAYAQGLAQVQSLPDMVVAYATRANDVAFDGTGRNSFFTGALVQEIAVPGLEVGQLFRRVSGNVARMTAGKQRPDLWITLAGEFYINPGETDVQAWSRLRERGTPDELREFMAKYPNSYLVDAARGRIESIESRQRLARLEQERRRSEEAARPAEPDRSIPDRAERAPADEVRSKTAEETRRLSQQPPPAEQGTASASRTEVAAVDPHPALPKAPDLAEAGPPKEGELVRAVQRELARVGCFSGRADGKWANAATSRAVREFARHARLEAPTAPSLEFLNALKERRARICPLVCGPREVERGGACVARTCPRGQRLDRDGACVEVEKPKPKPRVVERAPAAPARVTPRPRAERPASGGGGRRCFTFNGQSFCE